MTEQKNSSGPSPEILVVEDSAVEAELLRRVLVRAGYQTVMARNGVEGLQVARARRPALVLSDVNMPLMDGFELCRTIKYDNDLWNVPVILLTMLSEPEDIMAALNSGADGYITKPFVETILLERLLALLATPILRKRSEERRSENVEYNGEPYTIVGGSQQVLNMLFSVYEGSVFQNRDLTRVQLQLNILNEKLDQQVQERTAALALTNRRLQTLSAGNQALGRATSEEELLQSAVRNVVDNGGYCLAIICYAGDDPEKSITRVAVAAVGDDISLPEGSLTWADSDQGQMPIARTIRSGKMEVSLDISSDPNFASWKDVVLAHGVDANLALPLVDKSRVFGGLSIFSSQQNPFDEEELNLLQELASDLAYGIVSLRGRAELSRQVRQNTLILNSVGEGIFGLDREGRVTFINPVAMVLLQLTEDEIVGQVIHPLHHHPKADGTPYSGQECPIYAAYQDGIIHQVTDEVFWKKDGTSFPVEYVSTPMHDEKGELVGAVVSFKDISERLKSEELIRNILECVDEGFIIIDRDFKILSANKAYTRLVELPIEKIIGNFCFEVSHHCDKPCSEVGCDCVAQHVFATGESHSSTHRHENMKGEPSYIATSAYPLSKDSAGQVLTVIETLVDVSEQHKLETQLRQAQKMEAIGTLAGGIAHDFNNILTPILGYSELVERQLPPDSPERGLVLDIKTAGLRAKELVKQILTFSRQADQEHQPVQIHLVIKEALKLLRSTIPTTIAINQDVVDCGMVLADPTQIHQVLMNLCTNAFHAMRESGGELSVSLVMVELSAHDTLDNLPLVPGPHVKLSVKDTGGGMSKKMLERIFDPYFTTKKVGEGTGLGLSVVHGIVVSHQGHITVTSREGHGSEFCVYLPQVKVDENGSDDENEDIPHGSGTILVVDDEDAVGQLLQRMLTSLGYKVDFCSSSTRALEAFQQDPDRIDLVLTDMSMPGMNGAELTLRIKQLSPTTPVVLCTGYSEIMDEKKARKIGIDGYLLKPISLNKLGQTLHEVMRAKGGGGRAS